ncbi:hypothetical protein C0J52_13980 [Blattella germanica]|nr:hypothetical protein C0J52_13980 [Blattella germanica]
MMSNGRELREKFWYRPLLDSTIKVKRGCGVTYGRLRKNSDSAVSRTYGYGEEQIDNNGGNIFWKPRLKLNCRTIDDDDDDDDDDDENDEEEED